MLGLGLATKSIPSCGNMASQSAWVRVSDEIDSIDSVLWKHGESKCFGVRVSDEIDSVDSQFPLECPAVLFCTHEPVIKCRERVR